MIYQWRKADFLLPTTIKGGGKMAKIFFGWLIGKQCLQVRKRWNKLCEEQLRKNS